VITNLAVGPVRHFDALERKTISNFASAFISKPGFMAAENGTQLALFSMNNSPVFLAKIGQEVVAYDAEGHTLARTQDVATTLVALL
jgi:hypothetical protein